MHKSNKKLYTNLLRSLAIIIVCLFVLNDIAFGLAPSSRFKPMARVVKNDDDTYEITTDEGEQRFWDEETARSVRAGETFGKSFRNRVSFMYISSLIGQYLHLGISPHTVIPEIKRLVGTAEFAASKIDDPLLAGFEIEELSYHKEENAFYLPVYREGIRSFYYRYYIDSNNGSPDMIIPVAEDKHVYIGIEPVLEIEKAKPVSEVIREFRGLRHDLRNLISAFLGLRIFWEEMGCITPEFAQLLDLAREISDTIDALPVETKDEAVLHAYLRGLKELVVKARTRFAADNTEPILEEARQKVPEEEDPDRQTLVDDLVSNLDFAKNILVDQFNGSTAHVQTVRLNSVINTVMVANPTARRVVKRTYLAGDISIRTDEIALSRALANIVANAGEAIEDNGLKGGFQIITCLTGDEQNVRIILSDTAGGIRPEVLSRIFDEHFSTKKSEDAEDETKKRGQGLFIAKKYIEERCGGTIDVESEVGKGTTFTITLPVAGPAIKEEKTEEVEEAPSTLPERERIERFAVAMRSCRHGKGKELFDISTDLSVVGAMFNNIGKEEILAGIVQANRDLGGILYKTSDASKQGTLSIDYVAEKLRRLNEILDYFKTLIPEAEAINISDFPVYSEKMESVDQQNAARFKVGFREVIEKLESRIRLAAAEPDESLHSINNIIDDISALSPYMNVKNGLSGTAGFRGNRRSITNALSNIIMNADHFATKAQGEKAEVQVRATEKDGFAKIEITDNGEGIPEWMLDIDPETGRQHLFNLNVSDREGGTGLGTTEAWYAITDAGGTIEVESEPGKGTTFVVSIPLSDVKVRPRPLRHDELLASRTVPEDEGLWTTLFEDTVKLIQLKDEERPVILALGTDWMKGYEKGRYLQYDALNPLVASIRSFCETNGIVFIDGKEKDLLPAIEQAKGDSENAKVIVLASEKTVRSEDFELLRKDKNAFLAGVNNQDLTVDSYIRLVEMMNLALRLAFGRPVDFDNPGIVIKKVKGFPNLIIFVPKAEPMDYEILKEVYRIQTFA